ncbi:MAG: hypothetical protein HOG08_00650 [Candidatus Magasanikbacteria bacterium]|jgi:hypothetical protein|nr:hypothetical protein [Candidatus Magasanikbacteria bacterium]
MKKTLFVFAILVSIFFLTSLVSAQGLADQIQSQIGAAGKSGGMGVPVPPQVFIAELVRVFLGFIGTLFLALILRAGFLLFIAREREEKVSEAVDTVKRAVIGLFVIMIAYSITTFVGRAIGSNVAGKVYNTTDMQVDCGLWSMVTQGDFNCQLRYKN